VRYGEGILETRSLTMRFGGVVAVNDVNFYLREGELRCLIGPNGAGKSTFFKCLTGQLKPSEGRVLVRDRDVAGIDPFRIARLGVGIKTQVPSVFEGLTVHENLFLAARREHDRAGARERVADLLSTLRLESVASLPVGRLAHGQRQWVELGLVLAAEPSLILLDEPAAGMTVEEVERTAELLREINRRATLIVVEHDMHFIQRIAETVTVFHQGAILMEDHWDVVSRDPRVRDVYLGRQVGD